MLTLPSCSINRLFHSPHQVWLRSTDVFLKAFLSSQVLFVTATFSKKRMGTARRICPLCEVRWNQVGFAARFWYGKRIQLQEPQSNRDDQTLCQIHFWHLANSPLPGRQHQLPRTCHKFCVFLLKRADLKSVGEILAGSSPAQGIIFLKRICWKVYPFFVPADEIFGSFFRIFPFARNNTVVLAEIKHLFIWNKGKRCILVTEKGNREEKVSDL